MNRQSLIGLLPLFALGACAQPQNGTQDKSMAEEVVVTQAEEAMVQTVHLSVTGMT
ncbi:MAG: hypothetical protein O3A95_08085 [Planctomycetota bacterium]|nr:hypothetical protein [Planctomycetota bacterium]MDA1114241.1 hypothetical protein [Planctomycetota bacterium]